MKKIFLIRNVAADCYGGGETYQLKLAKLLKKSGFEPVILTSSKKLLEQAKESEYKTLTPPYIENQNWSGVRNLLLPIYFLKLHSLEKWYEKTFKKYKPEVVNIQSRDDFIAATIAAKKFGIKVLWTDHMDFRSWVMENVKVPYKNLIGKWILKCAEDVDHIVMISDCEKKFFDSIKKMDNVVVAKNGAIDEKKKYEKIKIQKQSFVYIGRVVDYKGIGELLEAFNMVKERYPESTLKIYGAGEIEKYRKMAGAGVTFYGETAEPLKALSENEIFILPSYKEGLSLSLLDAAMMEKVIIASDVGGNPEVVENNVTGLLVPAKNVKKLAEAMNKVLAEPGLRLKLAKNARKKYEEEFNFEEIFAKKMILLYNVMEEKNE